MVVLFAIAQSYSLILAHEFRQRVPYRLCRLLGIDSGPAHATQQIPIRRTHVNSHIISPCHHRFAQMARLSPFWRKPFKCECLPV